MGWSPRKPKSINFSPDAHNDPLAELDESARWSPPPLPKELEGLDDTEGMIARLQAKMARGAHEEEILLAELGLRQDDRQVMRLMSTVPNEDESFFPRPMLWNQVPLGSSTRFADPTGNWPARLLHVPTMTSIEWTAGNQYGDLVEPNYAILSYTWGRWRLPSECDPPHPALEVSNINWNIPPVDPKLFTVGEFQAVIKKIAMEASTEYVWVDVACIDQNSDSLQGAREIGRQAKIFATAKQAYLWLLNVSGGDSLLQDTFDTIVLASQALDDAYKRWRWEYASPKAGIRHEINESLTLVDLADAGDQSVMNAATAITSMTEMPWWTSLWTLQEAFLKPEACFIDRFGSIPHSGNGHPYELQNILSCCKQFHHIFSAAPNRPAGGPERAHAFFLEQVFLRVMQRQGLQALAVRDRVSLYSCANLRQASNPEDRIYGIMQIWNFELGKASQGPDKDEQWTLEKLELELGKQLIHEFPVESQLHVHTTQSVQNRQAWRISKTSDVPVHTLSMDTDGHLSGSMDRKGSELGVRTANDIMYGYFRGKVCSFTTLTEAWMHVSKQDHSGNSTRHQPSPVRISLDTNVVLNERILQTRHSLHNVPDAKQVDLAEQIVAVSVHIDRPISVLLLGIVTQPVQETSMAHAIGVMVIEAPDKGIGRWYKRLGICIWNVLEDAPGASSLSHHSTSLLSGDSTDWVPTQCLFG